MKKQFGQAIAILGLLLLLLLGNLQPLGAANQAAFPASAGTIAGNFDSGSPPANLTTLGSEDWAVWGYLDGGRSTSLSPDVRKVGGASISVLTNIGGGSIRGLGQFPGAITPRFSWSNGTPVATENDVATGLQHLIGANHGFSFTVPADSSWRRVYIFVSVHNGRGRLTATLSDGSAEPYIDNSLEGSSNAPGIYTIDYVAAAAGQTLTISWILESVTGANANPAIYAVALTDIGICDPSRNGVTIIHGTAKNDKIIGTSGHDLIYGYEGNDRIEGLGGDDCLIGGPGNDQLYGDEGNDILWGGEADNATVYDSKDRDKLYGDDGDDELHGGGDKDRLDGNDGDDTMYGDDGDDTLVGHDGDDTMYGGNGRDNMRGDDGDDMMYGEAGNDRLYGRQGDDTLDGGDDNDRLDGSAGTDTCIDGEKLKSCEL